MKGMSKNIEEFRKKHRNMIFGKSKLWNYKDDIKILLEDGFTIALIYKYLKDYYDIRYSQKYFYNFIRRNRNKILNSSSQEIYSNETIVKKDIYNKNTSNPSQNKNTETLKPKAVSKPDEAKKLNTEQNREKYKVTINEYKKYLEIYEKGITSLDPERNPKLSKDEFAKVMKMLYQKHHKTFDDLYELYKTVFREGRYPEFKKNTAERKLVIFFVFANKDKKIEVQTSINAGIPPFRPWEKISDFGW